MDRAQTARHDGPPAARICPPHPARRSLPNLLVPIDLRQGEPTTASLFALSESRRVARVAGATIFAIALTDRPLEDAAVRALGRAGADKVLLCEGPGLGAPALDATHGQALFSAVERIPPLLVLFPAGGAGPELGPSLAARLGAGFAASADLELGEAATPLADGVGRVFLRRWRRDRASYRRLDPVELERPIVALLPSAGTPGATFDGVGTENVEVEVIACPAPVGVPVRELASEEDDQAALTLASVVIAVDPAAGPELLAKLRALELPGLVVTDAAASEGPLGLIAPRVVIQIGSTAGGIVATPRSRTAVILPADAPAPAPGAADVVWRLPAGASAERIAKDLAAALAALGPGDRAAAKEPA
jgi:hypothetical protein